MSVSWSYTQDSSPTEITRALRFSSSLQSWSHSRQRENMSAYGRIITWYEVNPQPSQEGLNGSRKIRQLERILKECAKQCGRPNDVQGPSSAGIEGYLQRIYNTVRVKDELARMQEFHQVLRARRLEIANIGF